jgi:FkbM family methyltransferase
MSAFRTHFGLKHRITALISTRVFPDTTYTMRHGLAAGMRRKGGLGFLPIKLPRTAETDFFSGLRLGGKTVYDIGGFEGVLTLFFARLAAAVITYEPNPRNFGRCVENVALNRLTNVRVLRRGLSDRAGSIEITFDPLMPGAASGNPEVSRQIASSVKSARRIAVPVATLDSDVEEQALPPADFIKIDIEGMELAALRGMARTLESRGPDLFIELHGAEPEDKQRNTAGVLRFLEGAGYRVCDVENRIRVMAAAPPAHPPSHLYCYREGARSPLSPDFTL